MDRWGRSAWALLALVAILGVATGAGCSRRQGGSPQLAPIPTSTTLARSGDLSDPDLLEDGPATPRGETPDEIKAKFDQAIAAGDFCGLLVAMNTSLPDVNDPSAVVATYRGVADSLVAAEPIVPEELRESWVAVVDAGEAAATAAERSGGVIDDPALQAAFATAEFEAASIRLDAYAIESCPGTAG